MIVSRISYDVHQSARSIGLYRPPLKKHFLTDEKAVKALRKDRWNVITVWECKLKPGKSEKTLISLIKKILP